MARRAVLASKFGLQRFSPTHKISQKPAGGRDVRHRSNGFASAQSGKKTPTESGRGASERRPISLIVATTRPNFHRSLPHSAGRWLPARKGRKGWLAGAGDAGRVTAR